MGSCLICKKITPEGIQWCSEQCKEVFYQNQFGTDFAQKMEMQRETERQKIINSPDHIAFMDRASYVGYSQAIHELSKERTLPIENELVVPKKEKKENWLVRLWNKTIFSEWVKESKERKKIEREVKRKAKLKALEGMEDALAVKYRQQELEKMESGGILGKIGKGLANAGKEFKQSSFASDEKMSRMLGKSPGSYQVPHNSNQMGGYTPQANPAQMMGGGSGPNVDPSMLSGRKQSGPQRNFGSMLGGSGGKKDLAGMLGRGAASKTQSKKQAEDKIRSMLK